MREGGSEGVRHGVRVGVRVGDEGVRYMYLDSVELAEDGLVLGVVAGEITQDTSSAGDSSDII